MAIPDYQTVMKPLLHLAEDGAEHSFRSSVDTLAGHFALSEEERRELLPSGSPTFNSRVSWASTYLRKAKLLESTRRGYFRITPRGEYALKESHAIHAKYLERFPEFVAFQSRETRNQATPVRLDEDDSATPEEAIENAYQALRNQLIDELLEQVMNCSPIFFERLVVDLLVEMGYGGTRKDAGRAIGRSGDEGIDGIISEDRLGLDVIYIQAKKWEGTVGRPEIQKFVGALQGQRARKGIFITTSNFSAEATRYVVMIENKVILIDGQTLAGFMIDHGVGVSPLAAYEIKRVDSDYFIEG